MPLFETMTNFLKGPVGNNLSNDPEDVRNTKRHLNDLGYFDDEVENDFITRTLDTNIKSFQKDNDLKVDGKLYPNGETENSIVQNLSGSRLFPVATQQTETSSPAISSFGHIGENVDATGRMIRDQVTPTKTELPHTPIPSEYPQTPIPSEPPYTPAPEEPQPSDKPEEKEPEEKTKTSCVELQINLENKKLNLLDAQEKMQEAKARAEQAQEALDPVAEEAAAAARKLAIEVVITAVPWGKALKIGKIVRNPLSITTDVAQAFQSFDRAYAEYNKFADKSKEAYSKQEQAEAHLDKSRKDFQQAQQKVDECLNKRRR